MKKRTCILLMIFVALPIAVLFLGKKTLYLPVRTEIYFSSTERDEYLQKEIDYEYNWFGYLKELKYKHYWGRHTFYVDTNFWGNVTSYYGTCRVSHDVLHLVDNTYTYHWDGKLLSSFSSNTSSGETKERTYDFAGRLVCVKRIRGQYTVMMRYDYDKSGKLISGRYYRVNGETETLYGTTQITYDASGKRLSEIHSDRNGELLRQVDYRYENGNTITTVDRGNNIETLIFDAKGNIIEKSTSSGTNFSKSTYVHTYRAIRVPFWMPRRAFRLTSSLPALDFFDRYDIINVDL